MSTVTERASALRAAVDAHRGALSDVLARYGASNPRLFGSVARGDAHTESDVDLFVDLDAAAGNPLLRVAGIGEELSRILGVRVDVVAESLLREAVSVTAHRDMVAL
ncbi:nucleotidyltransferase [Rathayibacter sp. VKM Ac-2803]|uniref:nucleotidyltransferase family protein n=1 Tax=unclassified Rathayibacter TaxID=2609250 RepID=UPI0013577436|nr:MULTISPECIES: nucleotidyltransferase domain-containing protein [unclassified Rathayibacter]MWV50169.1 nucleotidyltransferase [Rathayibacter sp. VKM Ac-2803]MWV58249.1 nucleotidyltransferase [Rathayibacter sp. VKM Ac-2754]